MLFSAGEGLDKHIRDCPGCRKGVEFQHCVGVTVLLLHCCEELSAAEIRHISLPSLTGRSRAREAAYLDFNFLLVLKLAWILIQTGYCHMFSLKGHHLPVHPHSKGLLKTHLSVKYKEKPHLFQHNALAHNSPEILQK